MRYRIKRYQAWTGLYNAEVGNYLGFNICNIPDKVFDNITNTGTHTIDAASEKYIMESIRLIANETQGGYVVLSTGQKLPYLALMATRSTGALGNYISIYIAISTLIAAADGDEDDLAAISAMEQVGGTLTDQFTIEMDFGEAPSESSGDPLIRDFFGIVETPDEEVMSETEAIGILEDTWLAVTGSAAPHTDDWDGSGSGSGSGN